MPNPLTCPTVHEETISHDDLNGALAMVGGIENALPMLLALFGASADYLEGSPIASAFVRAFERREPIRIDVNAAGVSFALIVK